MMHRLSLSLGVIAVLTGVLAEPAGIGSANRQFYVGDSCPRSMSSRSVDDVLVRDCYYLNNGGFLVFTPGDFRGATVGGEYLVGLGDRFDAGLSIGFYSRSARAIDADFTHPDGSDVESNLSLRVVPMTATFRFLPLGHHDAFEPYFGAGVGILKWRYSESGDFVDTSNGNNIITGAFTGSGTEVGPVILGGIRVPIGQAGFGGEIRYQGGMGKLPSDQGFAGSTIDLGGFNYLFTVSMRF